MKCVLSTHIQYTHYKYTFTEHYEVCVKYTLYCQLYEQGMLDSVYLYITYTYCQINMNAV